MATTKFDVSSLLDKDLIVNQGTSGTDTTQDGIDYMGTDFVTQTFATSQDATNGNGLPDNGIFAANSYHPEIQLSYSNDNDGTNGYLINSFSTTARTQTFQFNVTTGQYGYVHLALSPNGHAPMDVSLTFNYSDGSSQTSSAVTVPDWQDTTTTESENLYYLASGLDLSTNDGSLFLEDSVAVFGVRFAANATKTLNSITVNATSNYDFPENVGLAFFGATGESNPNAVPTLTSSNAASIVENTTTVLTVAATDTDGDTLTYSLTGGDDQSKFSINSSSGALTFTSAPDYETPTDSNSDNIYQVEVTADDGKGGTAAQTISVTVTDEVENQAPTAVTLSNSTATLAEDADTTNGIKVADIAITDDGVGTNNLSLTGADAGSFEISGSELYLKAGTTLDFATQSSYDVTVEVDDTTVGATPDATTAYSLGITEVGTNAAPTAVNLNNTTTSLPEDTNTTSALKVADIAITDDGVGTNNLSLTGADAGSFEISGSELYLKAGTTLDFATQSSYDVTVEVDDTTVGATPDATTAYSLGITEVGVNAAPTAVNLNNTTTSLPEDTNTTSALKVADIAITDDGVGTNNLSLTGADAGSFEISGSELYLKAGTALDFATKSSYDVTVEVDDTTVGATPDATTAYSLGITEVATNNAPVVQTQIADQSLETGNSFSLDVSGNFSDPDAGDTLTYSATLANGSPLPGWLSFDSVTGQFSGTPTDSHSGEFGVQVTATDSSGESISDSFGVGVQAAVPTPTPTPTPTSTPILPPGLANSITVTSPSGSTITSVTSPSGSTFSSVTSPSGVTIRFVTDPSGVTFTLGNTSLLHARQHSRKRSLRYFRITLGDMVRYKLTGTRNLGPGGGQPIRRYFDRWRMSIQDGPIAGATAFLDTNFNGTQDSDEPGATTDDAGNVTLDISGNFDLNGNGTLDYDEGEYVVVGGTDAITGQPFSGTLRAVPGSTVVTPLTTLISALVDQGLAPEAAQTQLKTALGLPSTIDLSTFDPIAAAQAGSSEGLQVLAAQVAVQTLISQVSNVIGTSLGITGNGLDALVTANLAIVLESGSFNLGDSSAIQSLVNSTANIFTVFDETLNVESITKQLGTTSASHRCQQRANSHRHQCRGHLPSAKSGSNQRHRRPKRRLQWYKIL